MKKLHLTLKGQWFDMILANIKKEEYRELKPYWIRRLLKSPIDRSDSVIMGELCYDLKAPFERFHGISDLMELRQLSFSDFDTIHFTHGYAKSARAFEIECKGIRIGTGKPEWGGSGETFILSLGNIIKTHNI